MLFAFCWRCKKAIFVSPLALRLKLPTPDNVEEIEMMLLGNEDAKVLLSRVPK